MRPAVNQTVKRKFVQTLDLPSTVLLDQATIHLIGDEEMKIENHKGLVQYTTEVIKARRLNGTIEVVGADLKIASFSAHEIRILGQIHQVMLT